MCILDDIKRAVANHDIKLAGTVVYSLRCNNYKYAEVAELFEQYAGLDRCDFDDLMGEVDDV